MSEYVPIKTETLTNIADAVRSKTGENATMSPDEMVATLKALNITLQEKTVTPSESEQTVTPDEGYYGLSSVTVEAAKTGGSGGSMFTSTAVGIIPDIPKGFANSTLTIDFESSAIGSVS